MSNLRKRLRDWQTVHPCDADKPEGHLYEEAEARIAALEARVAAADALAEAAIYFATGFSGKNASKLHAALAAYQATREQSE